MNLRNIAGIIGGIVVAVMLLCVVLIPIADDDNYRSYATNTVGYTGTIADATEDIDLTLTTDSSRSLTINDVAYTYSVNDVALITNSAMLAVTTVSPYVSFSYEVDGVKTVNSNLAGISLTASEGTITATLTKQDTTTVDVTLEYDWICYRDNEGSDRIFNVITSSKTVYYSEDAPIYAIGPAGSAGYVGFVNDDVVLAGTSYTGTLDGTLYSNDVYETTLTYQNGSELYVTVDNTAYYPYYGAVAGSIETTSDSASDAYDLIGLVPLLVTVGIIMGIVGMLVTRR